MRFITGTTDVATAGTEQRIRNTAERVLSASFKGRPANIGNVFIGFDTTITSTNGWTLAPGNTLAIDFAVLGGSVLANTFYVDAATNGDDVDWILVIA